VFKLLIAAGALTLAGFVLVGPLPDLIPSNVSRQTAQAPVPTSVAATIHAPDAHEAQPIDPRKLAGNSIFYRGQNVELVGTATGIAQQDGYTSIVLVAQAPGDANVTQSLDITFRAPVGGRVESQQCYHLFGIIGESGPLSQSFAMDVYRLNAIPANDAGQCFAQWGA
jgi:hypothetical protein